MKTTKTDVPLVGMNQLLWYYAELEKQKCVDDSNMNLTTIDGLSGGRKNNRVIIQTKENI